MPALPAPVMAMCWNTTSRKSPQDSTPNCSALFSVDRIVESCTRMCALSKVRPRAKSLLNDSASSCASIREPVTSTLAVLMRFTPSRDFVASTVTESSRTSWQPFMSTAKCPPPRKVIPRTVTFAHRVSDSALSPCPAGTVLSVVSAEPSTVPAPVNVTLVRPSPHSSASWKWLCP